MADSDEKQQALNTANFAIYVLSVTVIEAKQLRAADMNGKSDPFVKCRVIGTNNKELGGFKTKVIEANNKNPKWDKFHVFSLFDKPVSIVFEVWDQDESAFGGKDDELGQATIDLNTYFGNVNGGKGDEMVSQLSETPQINEQWYVLDKIKKHKGEGCIKLTVKAERLVPLQTEKKLKSIKMELDNVQGEKMKQETMLYNKIKQLEGTVSKIETEKQDLLKQNNELKSKGAAPAPTESKDEEETSSNDLNLEITRLQGELAKNNNKITKLNQEYNELQVSYEKLKNSNRKDSKEPSNVPTSGNGAVNTSISPNANETETEMKREIANKNSQIEELNARVKALESRNKSTNNGGSESGQKKEQGGPDMFGQVWRIVLSFGVGIGIGVWYTNQSFSQS